MKAIDTNIIARAVLDDDAVQTPLAVQQLQQPCFISDTVLLETGWLLRSRYRLSRVQIARILREVIAFPAVTVSNPQGLSWALDRFEAGADLADTLHLINAGPVDTFISFDRDIEVEAGPLAPVTVETLG